MLYLELARRQRGWSQGALGHHPKVRIARAFISFVERGLGLPTADQAARIAKVLNLPVEKLLDEVPAPPADLPPDVPDVNPTS